MNKVRMYSTKDIYHRLDSALQFRFGYFKRNRRLSIAVIDEREQMTLSESTLMDFSYLK